MKTKVYDLSKTLKKYSNVWLALDPTTMRVVAAGKKTESVLSDAKRIGVSHPVLTRAPKDYGAYILSIS